jgi:hypothetical protein
MTPRALEDRLSAIWSCVAGLVDREVLTSIHVMTPKTKAPSSFENSVNYSPKDNSVTSHNTSSIRHHRYENLHHAPCSREGSNKHCKETAKFTWSRNTLNTEINLHDYTKIQFVPHRKHSMRP